MAMQNGDVLGAGGGWYKDWMTGQEQGPETGVVSAGFANLSWENHQKATEPRSYSEFDVRTFRYHSCPRCAHLCGCVPAPVQTLIRRCSCLETTSAYDLDEESSATGDDGSKELCGSPRSDVATPDDVIEGNGQDGSEPEGEIQKIREESETDVIIAALATMHVEAGLAREAALSTGSKGVVQALQVCVVLVWHAQVFGQLCPICSNLSVRLSGFWRSALKIRALVILGKMALEAPISGRLIVWVRGMPHYSHLPYAACVRLGRRQHGRQCRERYRLKVQRDV